MSNDSTTFTNSSWVNITDASHIIELDWQAATAGANNGKVDWWIDGTQQTGVSGIDNDTRRIDRVRLGAVSGVDATTNGTTYFDAFESRRSTYIGPIGGGLVTTTVTYLYDSLYRLKQADYSTGEYFIYSYDAVGNRLTQTICLGTPTCSPVNSTYAYDESNRLISVNGTAYTWDNNGNLLNDGTNTYAYDAANRLTSVIGGGTTSTYTYNGLGDRLSQTVNGTPTNYALDLNAGLTQVLSDGSNTYLYGAMRIGELQAGGMAYHLGDALGSVRQLVDASGSVTLARNFEPYGKVLNSAGTGGTTMSFTGEMLDASTNLLYLRARYLSTQAGRFISHDTFVGDPNQPMSYNRWLYADGNPINFTDPSGLVPCTETQTARFCKLTNGGYIDMEHFQLQKGEAERLIKQDLPNQFGKTFGQVEMKGVLGKAVPVPYSRLYYTKLPAEGLLHDKLVGVALAIILDYDYGFETAQGADPRCWTIAGFAKKQTGHCSSFSNEDLPSNYLAIISAGGISFDTILLELGGGDEFTQDYLPDEYSGLPRLIGTGRTPFFADDVDEMPWNYECTLKVYDPVTEKYTNKPWPATLDVKPIGFGVYWGRTTYDFPGYLPDGRKLNNIPRVSNISRASQPVASPGQHRTLPR
jgi:RHS repeat-associated protein